MKEMPDMMAIVDSPAELLVTPDVLKTARALSEVEISDYNSFSVDFLEGVASAFDPADKEFLQCPPKICDSALDLIGRTPMVRLTRLAKKYGLQCDLVAKCEYMSIGGSVKDRIGKQMISEAELSGRIKPGDTIVEATSGNTGVGLALVAALKGYRCLITLPEKMSQEKLNTMAALGAEIIRTPTEAAWNSINSHIGLAVQLQHTLPNCHFLDQYSNPANPRAHYLGTAEEILYQCDDKIDVLVMTVGTGGTVTGVAKKVKERVPTCKIVGVDPKGSILAEPDSLNEEKRNQSYLVEGIGYDFIPPTLHRKIIDEWIKTDDADSFRLARELIHLEGLLVGGSSGSALVGALEACRHLGPNDRCVVLLPDSARNYMTKFIADDWMFDNEFYRPSSDLSVYGDRRISDIQLNGVTTILKSSTIKEAVNAMAEDVDNQSTIIVLEGTKPIGIVTQKILSSALLSGRYTMEDSVARIMVKKFRRARPETLLADLARMFEIHQCIVVTNTEDELLGMLHPINILKELAKD